MQEVNPHFLKQKDPAWTKILARLQNALTQTSL
jgi:hypothetical protein